MALEGYTVEITTRGIVASFIEEWHYSHNLKGVIGTAYFGLFNPEGMLVGAALFGPMAMPGQWKRFADDKTKVIELRRLCCIDATPKNAESFLIGASLRHLKKHSAHSLVVSYADAEYGHEGTIYKASNFAFDGFRKGYPVIVWEGKQYHDKSLRGRNGDKPSRLNVLLHAALEKGEAHYKKTAGKYCYVYRLRK